MKLLINFMFNGETQFQEKVAYNGNFPNNKHFPKKTHFYSNSICLPC